MPTEQTDLITPLQNQPVKETNYGALGDRKSVV